MVELFFLESYALDSQEEGLTVITEKVLMSTLASDSPTRK